MRGLILLLTIIVAALLSACQRDATLPQAIISTPVEDLPISSSSQRSPTQYPTPISDTIISAADAEYMLLTNLYERATPSVINVEANVIGNTAGTLEVSRGSGFVFDFQGHIITSAHVVKDAQLILITFNNGYVIEAELIGLDTYSDLAVLRVAIEQERLVPLPLIPNSDTLRVGQRAIAIGNPFGLSSSMSVGIISGLGRKLLSAELMAADALPGFQNPSIIQTDAPINPGSSGGPLLNSQGQVMGVNAAIRSDSGVFQGVGFAVPANTVRRVVPELIQNGVVNYAWMGIRVNPEENGYGVSGLASALDLPVETGILVRGVTINSPAHRAGLQGGNQIVDVRGQPVCIGGDIIVAVDGVYVNSMDELVTYLVVNKRPRDTVILLVIRNRETYEVTMTLDARPTLEGSVQDCIQ